MNETAHPQRLALPAADLRIIKAIASTASLASADRLLGVLLLVWGRAWYERQDRIDPTAIRLPEEQWREVCGYLTTGVPGDAIDNVNLGIQWMNRGPSGGDN